MPRYIDADALISEMHMKLCDLRNKESFGVDYRTGFAFCMEFVKAAPTISPDEARGVVHCGECGHADKDQPGAIYCTMWDAWGVPEDGFCYKGAKMEVSEDV